MSLTKCNTGVNVHSSLPDAPTLTATELKTAWDSAAVGLKNYLNNTLTEELDSKLSSIPSIVNSLATGGTTAALSAEQGKILNTLIDTINNTKQKIITSGTVAKSNSEGSDGDIYLRYR